MAGLGKNHLKIAKTIKLYIGGAFPRTESGRSFPVYEHGSKTVYAHLCLASRKDFRNSIVVAQKAGKGWSGKSAYNRSQILYRMAEMAEGKRHEFVEIFESTLGYSEEDAHLSIDEAIDTFVYYAGFADKYQQVIGAVNPVAGPHHNFTTPEPVGVVALLCNNKFNFAELVDNICSIICSGNTLVALLGEEGAAVLAPLSEIFATSDVPAGVINLLSGKTEELKSFFGSHMEVNSLSVQQDDNDLLGELRELGIENMKRVIPRTSELRNLDNILKYVEYKTVWHPIGV